MKPPCLPPLSSSPLVLPPVWHQQNLPNLWPPPPKLHPPPTAAHLSPTPRLLRLYLRVWHLLLALLFQPPKLSRFLAPLDPVEEESEEEEVLALDQPPRREEVPPLPDPHLQEHPLLPPWTLLSVNHLEHLPTVNPLPARSRLLWRRVPPTPPSLSFLSSPSLHSSFKNRSLVFLILFSFRTSRHNILRKRSKHMVKIAMSLRLHC